MVTKQRVAELVKEFGGKSGSAAVQIALLTERISGLTSHFENHAKDHSSKRGLMKLIGQRRRLLKYLSLKDEATYQDVLKKLNLRK